MQTPIAIRGPAAALLLVDLQEEHRLDRRYLVEGYGTVLANAGCLLEAARTAGVAVIHGIYIRDFARQPRRPFEPVTAAGTPTFSDGAGALTEICREVAPRDGEAVIVKNDASCFAEAGMGQLLTRLGTEWLIVCGVWTEACVAATVRDATAAGHRVLLVKDACGSGTAAMHQTAIINLANRLYGGAVADTERACAILAGATREAWRPEVPAPLRFGHGDVAEVYGSL
jgi:maleamate amidohydrolase